MGAQRRGPLRIKPYDFLGVEKFDPVKVGFFIGLLVDVDSFLRR